MVMIVFISLKLGAMTSLYSPAIGASSNPIRGSTALLAPAALLSKSVVLSAEEGGHEDAVRLVDQHMKEDHSFRELSGQLMIPSHSKCTDIHVAV